MVGWIIFLLGIACIVIGAYSGIGWWVSVLVAVCWFIMIIRHDKKVQKHRDLMKRLEEKEAKFWGELHTRTDERGV